jgi:hypothetical protein
MQATRGFATTVRSRGRLIGGSVALVALVAAFVAPSAASAKESLPITEQYLALGDSLAFGYSSQLYHEGTAAGYVDPEGFEHGYPNAFLKKIKSKAMTLGKNVKLVNDGCPGETSSGAIGSSESLLATLNAALKASQEEHGLPPVTGESPCAYQKAWNAYKTAGIGGPLHHPYSGSQLEDALEVIRYAQNVEKKPVTTISLNIGANDELHAIAKVEAEAKAFVEAKVTKKATEFVEAKLAKIGKEAVEAKLAKIGKEAVEAKLKKVAEEAVAAKLKKVGEEAVAAKLKKVAEEAIAAKVAEQVFIKCSEKAFAETGGEEPQYAEKREECLATEGETLGGEYYFEHKAELEKEGEEAAFAYYGAHKAELEKEGEEAAFAYYGAHKAELEKEGEEAAFAYYGAHKAQLEEEGKEAALAYFFANKAKVEKEGEEAAFAYYGAHKAEIEKEAKEFGEKYAAEHLFELSGEGELYGAELVGKLAPGLFAQIISNINGILVALRNGGTLGLDGGKAVNYTGRIIFQGGYNPYGKQFNLAFEGVKFVEEHGGLFGPYKVDTGRCVVRGLTAKQEQEKVEAGCPASELQPGFTALVNTLNSAENTDVKVGFGVCMSFPAAKFNPISGTIQAERLKLWTNMTNGSQTVIGGTPTYNGPDIHPTPAGYTELGTEMLKVQTTTCKKEGLPGF